MRTEIGVSYKLKGEFCWKCKGELWFINKGDYTLLYCDNLNCDFKHKNKHLW